MELHRQTIVEMAECGDLLWVFDLASKGSTRAERRYWLGELLAKKAGLPVTTSQDEALRCIIGHELAKDLRTETVADILQSQRQTVHEWLADGQLTGCTAAGRAYVHRASLVKFLAARRLT